MREGGEPGPEEPRAPARGVVGPELASILLPPIDSAPYSPAGYAELRTRVQAFIEELSEESARIARRHHAEAVSASYVRAAAERLVSRLGRRWAMAAAGIGSAAFGAGMSELLQIAWAGETTAPRAIATALLMTLGALGIATQRQA